MATNSKDHENHGNNENQGNPNSQGNASNNQGKDEVIIKVNTIERKIHRGNQKVSDIKTVGEVPQSYDLDQLIEGKLVPLKDDGSVVIKGGEEFFGHIKDGSSS